MNAFLGTVRESFASLADQYGFREVHVDDYPVLKRIVYANVDRMLSFFFDARDNYIDLRYGRASGLDGEGQPMWPASEMLGSFNQLLRRSGTKLSVGEGASVDERVRAIVRELREHAGAVLGSSWDADGS